MSIQQLVLASVSGGASQHGDEVLMPATAGQLRGADEPGVYEFGASASYSEGAALTYDAITAAVRWTGVRIVFDGVELPRGAYRGSVEIDESLGEPRTAKFSTIGHLWAVPTQDVPALGPFVSSRSWGNKPVEIYLSFGVSPRTMVE